MPRITIASLQATITQLQREIDDLKTVVAHQKKELDLYQMIERPSRKAPAPAPVAPRGEHPMAAATKNSDRYLRVIQTSSNYREVLDAAKQYAALTGKHIAVPSGAAVRARA